MRYNFYIDYSSEPDIAAVDGVYVEAFPDNVAPFKINRTIVTSDMPQYFMRLLWGELEVSNNPKLFASTGFDIYRLFEVLYNLDFSQRVLVKYVTDSTTIYGYFGRNDCNFDYDKKILKVEPAVLDEYTDILENWETDVDFNDYIFTENNVTVEIANSSLVTKSDWPWPSIVVGGQDTTPRNRVKESDFDGEGGLPLYFDSNAPKETLFADEYWGFAGTHIVLPPAYVEYTSYNLQNRVDILGQNITPDNYEEVPTEYGDWELSKFRVYKGTRIGGLFGNRWRQLYCQTEFSREEETKVDVIDLANEYGFESPVGDGWNMRETRIKDGKNGHLWTRVPFNGAYSADWEIQPLVENNEASDYSWNWYEYLETKLLYDNTDRSFELVSTINLKDFLTHLLQNTSEQLSVMNIRSTFFFNDDEDSLEVLAGRPGFNYVTGEKNYLNNSKIFFTRDLVSADENEIDNIPLFSLKSILADLNKQFFEQLIWFTDDDGYFRIEHNRYVDLRKVSLDISDSDLLNFTTQWEYDKARMFELFEFSQVNSGYIDFTNNKVTFNKIISNNRNQDLSHEVITRYITTDAKYCILNPNDISSGIILLAVGDDNVVLNKIGDISKVLETNGYLALSNILLDFGRYSGVWHYGQINNRDVTFTVTNRTKLGIELKLRGVKKSLFYTTQIGVGLIDSGTIDFENENTTIKLRYRYNSNVNGDIFVLAFQKETDFVGAVNNWADIDNYSIIT